MSILDFLNPGLVRDPSLLRGGAEWLPQLEGTRERQLPVLDALMLRRTKESVAIELPPKIVCDDYCELTPQQVSM